MIINKLDQNIKIEKQAQALLAKAKTWKKCYALFPVRVSETEQIWLQSYEIRFPNAAFASDAPTYKAMLRWATSMNNPNSMILRGHIEFRYKNADGVLTTSTYP